MAIKLFVAFAALLLLIPVGSSSAITIDGNFDDWQDILADSNIVIYDGPWDSLTDLDSPNKPAYDLIRFAQTWDSQYIYFYFERLENHDHTDLFVYIDSNNNGVLEQGEPVARFQWSKDKRRYTPSVGVYRYEPGTTSGDSMDCGDGCTMPGKQKLIWKKLEKMQGASEDYTKLETRLDWDWLNVPIDQKCKSCEKVRSITMQLAEPLTISEPTNVSIYDKDGKRIQQLPITPENTTFVITEIRADINVTVDGTEYTELIHASCSQPIGDNMIFDEFEIIYLDADKKKDCILPEGFSPAPLQFHISSARGRNIPKDVEDNLNASFLTLADTTPPTIYWINATPNPAAVGQIVNFTAKIADAGNVSSVLVEINGANYTMTTDGDDIWHYLWTATPAGDYTYTVWASDTSSNWAQKSGSLSVLSPALAIALSTELASGVEWDITALPAVNAPANGNNGAGATGYYVIIEAIGMNADLYIKADGDLNSDTSYIPLANEKVSFSTTDPTVPTTKNSLTATFSNQIGHNMTNNAKSWLKFFLDVPAGQPAGNYTNILTFKVVQTGTSP